jgi:hypothetical protein
MQKKQEKHRSRETRKKQKQKSHEAEKEGRSMESSSQKSGEKNTYNIDPSAFFEKRNTFHTVKAYIDLHITYV